MGCRNRVRNKEVLEKDPNLFYHKECREVSWLPADPCLNTKEIAYREEAQQPSSSRTFPPDTVSREETL